MRLSTAVLFRFVVLASLLLTACGGVTGDIDNIVLLPSEPPIPARAPIKLTAGMKNLSGATAGQVRYTWSVQVGSQQANALPETGPGLTYQLPDIERGDVTFTVQASVNGTPIAGAQASRTVNVERVTISAFRVSDANGQEVGDSVPPGTRLRLDAVLPDTPAARATPVGVQFTGPGGQLPVDASRAGQVTVPADVSSVRLTARLLYDGIAIDERQVELKVATATPTPTQTPTSTPMATQTSTPTPTPTLGPPQCSPAAITRRKLDRAQVPGTGSLNEPARHTDVAWETTVKGRVEIPEGVTGWIMVFAHRANRYWTQSPDALLGQTFDTHPDGTFDLVSLFAGKDTGVRECFDVVLVVADAEGSKFLADRLIRDARANDYPGIVYAELIDRGIREVDSITVRRK